MLSSSIKCGKVLVVVASVNARKRRDDLQWFYKSCNSLVELV